MSDTNKFGLFISCLGGIIAIAGLAIYYEYTWDAVTSLGLMLLLSAMFFALGGAFTKNSQWTNKAMVMFGFLTFAVSFIATASDIFEVNFGVVEAVISILIIVVAYLQKPLAAVKN